MQGCMATCVREQSKGLAPMPRHGVMVSCVGTYGLSCRVPHASRHWHEARLHGAPCRPGHTLHALATAIPFPTHSRSWS